MRNIFNFLLSLFLLTSFCFAKNIANYVNNADFDLVTDVGILIYNLSENKIIYEKSQNKAFNPASILKVLTLGVSKQVLGKNYSLETSLFKDDKNNIYIKLAGDPLLTQKDLNNLLVNLKNEKINNVYIDDSIFIKEDYPQSWLEEDKWPNSRIISPYIIDNNITEIAIHRSSLATKVDIIQNDDYKIPIINELKLGDVQNIQIERNNIVDSPIINFKGTVKEDSIINLPVLMTEINFKVKLEKSLNKYNLIHNNPIQIKNVPFDAKKIASVNRPLDELIKKALFNSDNYITEIIFRVAASKYYQKPTTLDDGITMFDELYGFNFKNNEQIVDASGVSRQNFLSPSTIFNIAMDIFKKTAILDCMPNANEGTMKDRLIFLEGNLRAKTGTMKNQSSIIGTIKTRNNNDVLFISIIQNSNKRKSLLKHFENSLIGIIYKKY